VALRSTLRLPDIDYLLPVRQEGTPAPLFLLRHARLKNNVTRVVPSCFAEVNYCRVDLYQLFTRPPPQYEPEANREQGSQPIQDPRIAMGIYRRILLPVDGSPASDRGAGEAVHLARDQAAALLVLHVIDTLALTIGGDSQPYLEGMMDAACEAAEGIVWKVKTAAHANGVEAETRVIQAVATRVTDIILEQTQEWQADLIVMGTHGRRGINRLYLGSDAEWTVRNSPVPVLLVRAEVNERDVEPVRRHESEGRNRPQTVRHYCG
jgi:nucleotide-binding universal stress UspA family protein